MPREQGRASALVARVAGEGGAHRPSSFAPQADVETQHFLAVEADGLGAEQRERPAELWAGMLAHPFLLETRFKLTTRYEIAFWEMATSVEFWPGIPAGA